MNELPNWIIKLEKEDLNFIKRFILYSGSLKEIAKYYEVTYPTIRLRLDRLIQKIQLNTEDEQKPFVSLIRTLAIDEKIDFDAAKILIDAYTHEGREDT